MGSSIMYLYTKFSKKTNISNALICSGTCVYHIRGFIIILKSFFFPNSSSNSLKCKIFVSSAKWKLWNVWWIYLDHLCINRKGRFLEQSPVEHLFELPEYLRYDHGLRQIVSCFLDVMQTIICNFYYIVVV